MYHRSPRSTRTRIGKTQHGDLTAEKGFNSLSHNNLLHKPISKLEAMDIPDSPAAVDKRVGKTRNIARMARDESQEQKKEVCGKGHKKRRTVNFATLMDSCHLKKTRKNFLWYKGRVVLQGDVVEDDSRSYAVFTEQGSSASQMTARTEC